MHGERSRAQATLDALDSAQRADVHIAADVREAVEHLGWLVGLLQVSEAKLRSRFYKEAGVLFTYLPDTRSVDVEADPCVRKVRVGGAYDPMPTLRDSAWGTRPRAMSFPEPRAHASRVTEVGRLDRGRAVAVQKAMPLVGRQARATHLAGKRELQVF